jgi:hypothetical protein
MHQIGSIRYITCRKRAVYTKNSNKKKEKKNKNPVLGFFQKSQPDSHPKTMTFDMLFWQKYVESEGSEGTVGSLCLLR